MTTKNCCFSTKENNQNDIVGDNLNNHFNNLNLNQNENQNYKCLSADMICSKSVTTNEKRRNLNNVSENLQEKNINLWNKNDNKNLSTKNSFLTQNISENSKLKKEKLSNSNNSTLSLHIAAYENSVENSDENSDENSHENSVENSDETSHEFKEKGLIKKWKNKNASNFSSDFQNPFEFPRQQKENQKPEIMQFKASQKLLNPNLSENVIPSSMAENESSTASNPTLEKFKQDMETLEKSTKTSFNLYQEEHEKAKQHFHQIRLEIALKTSELVNAVFRRMNDCALSVESYESRFEQTFIDVTQEYQMKEEQMKNLKKTCLDIANNDPLPQLSNFISGSFSQTSVEMSVFTNKIVNSIREFSALPKFILDTGPVINILNNTAKFSIQGQIVHPLYRTDPTLKLIDVPISKLAENPISELSANRKQGEKRPGGPYFDAFEAKKIRSEESEFSASEIAGTKIIHPSKADFIPITPSPPVQTPIPIIPYQSRNTFPTILKEKPQSSQQQQQQQRLPIIAPKLPSVAHGFRGGAPIITFRPRGNLQYQIPSSSAFSTYNPPQYQRLDGLQQNVIPANQILPLSYNNQVINRFGNQGIQQAIRNFPHYLQIRPRPLTRVINASSNNGNGNMNNYNRGSHIQNANNSNQGTSNQDVPRLPRVPVVPHLKKGSDSMQKALMDIIVQPGGRVVRQRLTSKSSDKPASNSTSSKRNKKSSESISHQQEEEEEEETNETNGKLRRSARLSKHK